MSVLKTKNSDQKKEWTKFVIPAYIVFSALFIVYVIYSSLQNVVYQSGVQAGQQEGLTVGQQQGYSAAVGEIITGLDGKCETLTLTSEETKIDIVNVACVLKYGEDNLLDTGE